MTYRVYCREARLRGAIGTFNSTTITVEAENADAACMLFWDKYETRFGTVIAEPVESEKKS